ncbi:MAG: addiction module toxin RelE [Ruminococcaceae bacterium]|nr:addiction module toxin RelE [Oscillospiraceae bacterium]
MTREFIMLPEFDKQWKAIGFDDNDLKALQEELTINPEKGEMMRGTGGLRKIRVAFEGRGKSGSARACYVDFAVYEKIYMISAYTKNDKDNLTKEERNEIKRLIEVLKNTQRR